MKQLKENLNEPIYNNEFTKKLIDAEPIFNEILQACNNRWASGSYLIEGVTYDYSIDMYPKQLLLYETAKKATHVLEIGTYIGHSLLIMLLANPNLNVITIDIDQTFAKPSVQVLQKHFPNAKIYFLHSDSLKMLPKLKDTFNLFHIDGHHDNSYITQEFECCLKMCRDSKMRVIFDDIDCCRDLEAKILSEYNILQHKVPNCKYPNSYFEIQQ